MANTTLKNQQIILKNLRNTLQIIEIKFKPLTLFVQNQQILQEKP